MLPPTCQAAPAPAVNRPWRSDCHENANSIAHGPWRPKASVRQDEGGPEARPGYFWLAYDWGNLFVACMPCNQSKGILFPLANPTFRADPAVRDVSGETPLLVKPDGPDDPADHIGFVEEIPKGRTDLGRRTVAVVGLDETKHERRRDCLTRLKRTREIMLRFQEAHSSEGDRVLYMARYVIDVSTRPDAVYCGMARAYVGEHFETIGSRLFARATIGRKHVKRGGGPP